MNSGIVNLDKKLQMYITTMAVQSLPFGREWGSSAKKLEDELKKRGIVLQDKLFYEYKMPGGLGQSDFMSKLIMDEFCNDFYSHHFGKVLLDKKLSFADKMKIFKYVQNMRSKTKDMLKQYESEIRNLNPELATIKVNVASTLVYGAMFGFAPKEIAYCADAHRDFAQEKENEKILKNYGINLTYVLAPDTAKKIIATLQQNVQNNIKER